jgi:hypothetical protein
MVTTNSGTQALRGIITRIRPRSRAEINLTQSETTYVIPSFKIPSLYIEHHLRRLCRHQINCHRSRKRLNWSRTLNLAAGTSKVIVTGRIPVSRGFCQTVSTRHAKFGFWAHTTSLRQLDCCHLGKQQKSPHRFQWGPSILRLRRATLPHLEVQYHCRRWAWLRSSEWDPVFPHRHQHSQVVKLV